MQIEGSVVLVTGAKGGIGKYYIEALLEAQASADREALRKTNKF